MALFLTGLTSQGIDYQLTVVEQNERTVSKGVLTESVPASRLSYFHEPDVRGLSRGRNSGLRSYVDGVVGFPDDDCQYPPGLLSAVLNALRDPKVDGISVSQRTVEGGSSMLRWRRRPGRIRAWSVPRTVNSSTIFLKARLVKSVGLFSEDLGAGAGTAFGAGEENDFVLRALRTGARIQYRPDLFVVQADWRQHMPREDALCKAEAYNRGFGQVLRRNGLNGQACYWIGRSVLGVVVALLCKGDARFQCAQLRGRWAGFRA